MKIKNRQDFLFNAFNYAVITILTLIVLYPVIYVVSASFSNPDRVAEGEMWLWPVEATLVSYKRLLMYENVWIGYKNTILYTVGGTLVNLAVTLMCAYPLARKNLRGRGPLMFMFSFTMMFGGGMIPGYILIKNLGLLNSRWVMIIPSAMSVYNMIVARTFIQSNVPDELLQSAQIDGSNNTYFFLKIVLPLIKPVIAVLAMWYAVGHWNSYFGAFLYLKDTDKYPLQIFLKDLLVSNQELSEMDMMLAENMSNRNAAVGMKYAIIVVSSAPLMCIYPFIQKYFRQGVLVGSIKG